jgi:RNA polymerase sigma-70 factor (sigma-E family)
MPSCIRYGAVLDAESEADAASGRGHGIARVVADLAAFVTARGAALRRFAYLLSGDRQRAEDLVQSALARVLRDWPRVAAMEHPEAYVRQVIVREHLSWRRRRASSEIIADDLTDRAGAAGDFTTTAAERDAAWRMLATLPARQRAVLVLRFYEDLDDSAVARALGTTESTVRSNAARGLAALRRKLAPAGDPATKEVLP